MGEGTRVLNHLDSALRRDATTEGELIEFADAVVKCELISNGFK